jgi:argininosuccinate lyase
MYRQDIAGSRAHAKMLNKIGVLTDEDFNVILGGLDPSF